LRLPYYDYAGAGVYFVTIVAKNRECLFGDVVDGVMRLSDFGRIVEEEWLRSAEIRREIQLDAFVVMPNHVHGIVVIDDATDQSTDADGPNRVIPHLRPASVPRPGTLRRTVGTFIGGFKTAATIRINALRDSPGLPVWQRGYHDHIVRNEVVLDAIRRYIDGNPQAWENDEENPATAQRHSSL
jgi:REP element-mobilizing transposase RayT